MLTEADCWRPPSKELGEEYHAMNHEYVDYRSLRWADVDKCELIEADLLANVEHGKDYNLRVRTLLRLNEVEHDLLTDEAAEDALYEIVQELPIAEQLIFEVDLGCATAIAALAAAKCPPFSSCNGAVFGGHHRGDLMYVAFYANKARLGLLNESALVAGVELEIGSQGCPIVFTQGAPSKLLAFGQAMNRLRRRRRRNAATESGRIGC